jgi:hypothetical protein
MLYTTAKTDQYIYKLDARVLGYLVRWYSRNGSANQLGNLRELGCFLCAWLLRRKMQPDGKHA